MNRLFVGNIPWRATEDDIKEHFETIGKVFAVKIVKDRQTGRSRGFGFVDMGNIEEAIQQLDGKFLHGRPLAVKEAVRRPNEEKDRFPGHRRSNYDEQYKV